MAVQNLTSLPGVSHVRGVFIVRWPAGRLFIPEDVVGLTTTELFEDLLQHIAGTSWGDKLIDNEPVSADLGFWDLTFTQVKNAEYPWLKWLPDVGNADPNEWVMTSMTTNPNWSPKAHH